MNYFILQQHITNGIKNIAEKMYIGDWKIVADSVCSHVVSLVMVTDEQEGAERRLGARHRSHVSQDQRLASSAAQGCCRSRL